MSFYLFKDTNSIKFENFIQIGAFITTIYIILSQLGETQALYKTFEVYLYKFKFMINLI